MMDVEIELRQATGDDIPEVLRVIQRAFEEYRGKLDPPSGAFSETEEALHGLLQTEAAVVAVRMGQIIGCVFYDLHQDALYFHRLALLPEARGQGIGRKLMGYVEAEAAKREFDTVRLAVRVTLPEMRHYYERAGYRVIDHQSHRGHELPTYYIMEKELADPFDPVSARRKRAIVVAPYNPAWPAMYAEEAARLTELFGDELVAIHHIGSTAIVGIHAKPIIDILPVVRDIERVNALNPSMIAAGYDPRGENGIPGRRYFDRNQNGASVVHIHTFQEGHPDVARHVDFCAYLNAHPDEARRYADLKQQLARDYPHDINGYITGKTPFIQEIEAKAIAWRVATG